MNGRKARQRYASATARRLARRGYVALIAAGVVFVFVLAVIAGGGLAGLTVPVLYLLGVVLFLAGTAFACLFAAGAVDSRTVTVGGVGLSGCRADNPTNPQPERVPPTPGPGDNPSTRQTGSPSVAPGGES